ncbi:hypothetical protein M404DRAFT_26512 [Pisolithus tinctorius Marx 270]|uniref:Uncharacterized protein n=1 Tax=Pisolithus tinctorius Marx 270 TaxID=870435 RepID=A0A0C3P9U1_PISTI|nr:hypothetical protein M404DRAFT_26512 [Pisolithus tinctorius Marx 270]
MSSTSQNQTKSNNNSSKSGKRTAVPQLSQPPRPTGVSAGTDVAAAIKLSLAWSTAAHKRLAARKESKGQEGRKMDVEQATAPEGEEGGEMDIKQVTVSEGQEEMDIKHISFHYSNISGQWLILVNAHSQVPLRLYRVEEMWQWRWNSGGKKSPKKNSKKHGHQDEVEDTAGTETGGVSEAVSQSKHQKKSHKDPPGHRWYSPPKEIPTRKHGPKASKGKGKDGGISQEWEAPSVASGQSTLHSPPPPIIIHPGGDGPGDPDNDPNNPDYHPGDGPDDEDDPDNLMDPLDDSVLALTWAIHALACSNQHSRDSAP